MDLFAILNRVHPVFLFLCEVYDCISSFSPYVRCGINGIFRAHSGDGGADERSSNVRTGESGPQ